MTKHNGWKRKDVQGTLYVTDAWRKGDDGVHIRWNHNIPKHMNPPTKKWTVMYIINNHKGEAHFDTKKQAMEYARSLM